MHKDQIKGKVREAEGKLQKAFGDLTDNPVDQEIGEEKQLEGKFQHGVGTVKDALHKAID
jgi:uncharacterized protein YjbJ (UPF0337 family)